MSVVALYRSPARRLGRSVVRKLTRLIWGGGPRGDHNSHLLDERWLAYGCTVVRLDKVGDGVPDRLIGMITELRRIDFLVEYKNPNGDHNYKKLRETQVIFHERWRGRPPNVVETVADIDCLFLALKKFG